jgi:hypothetical protein
MRDERRLATELCLSVQSDETDVVEPAAGPRFVFWMQYGPLYPEILWERSAALFARQQIPLAVGVLFRVEFSQSYHQPVRKETCISLSGSTALEGPGRFTVS